MSDYEDGLYYDEDEYEDFDASQDFDRQLQQCGYDPDFPGKCHDVGTEWCSFHCPLHASVFREDADDLPF